MAVHPGIDRDDRRAPVVPLHGRAERRAPTGRNLRLRLVAGDAAAVALAWIPQIFMDHSGYPRRVALASLAAMCAQLVVAAFIGLYRSSVCATMGRQFIRAVAVAACGCAAFHAVARVLDLPSSWLHVFVSGAISVFLILGLRWQFGRWLKDQRARGKYLRTVVLVGTNADAVAVSDMLTDEPELGYRVGAVVGESCDDPYWSWLPHSAEVTDLISLAQEVQAAGVMIVDGAVPASDSALALRTALEAGLHAQIWPALPGVMSSRVRFAPVSGVPVLYIEPARPAAWQLALKRVIDVVAAAFLLPLTAPLMIAAAIAIKLEDGGPVLYRHAVVGRYGRPIVVLKLRTMVPNAAERLGDLASMNERRGGPLFKASNDPRVTKVGRLLRATSIDELPQLWNVLTGTMSLVGPRFSLFHEAAEFDKEHQRRTEMRPGITGLWQTEARDNPSFSAYRRLDLLYVDNWSLALDVKLMINTAHAVIMRAVRAVAPRASHPTAQAADAAASPVQRSGVDAC